VGGSPDMLQVTDGTTAPDAAALAVPAASVPAGAASGPSDDPTASAPDASTHDDSGDLR
jgi:hypothetical protein